LKIENLKLQIEERQKLDVPLGIFNFQFLLVMLLLSGSTIHAQAPSPPLFDLHTAEGLIASGSLEHLHEDWSVSVNGKKTIQVRGSDLVSLRQSKTPIPPAPRGERVVLTNGDQLAGTAKALRAERLLFQPAGTEQELTLPISAVSLLCFPAADGGDDSDLLRRRLPLQRRDADSVLLGNGDLMEGTLTALDAGMIRIESKSGKALTIARDKVAALALTRALARSLGTKAAYGRLVLGNGSRLSLVSARTEGDELVAKTLFGATLRVPVRQMVGLDMRQGRAVYLSDLNPRRYEHTPYLGVRWPYTLDTSIARNELRVAGSTYDKGIGMHSESRLTFNLGGQYEWFEAWVGLDERTGSEGSVVVGVVVDGKSIALGTKELTGRDKPLPVRVRVADARELTLEVLFGRHGDVQDHVDWVDARLIK
jgi:hypothetical protein